MKGLIFDIKQFAVFDGPGIRQTVFMKGCPLHCSWCHNPEGQLPYPQLMVSYASCTNCGACRTVCPHLDACTACGICVSACPLNLRHISGEYVTSEELKDRLDKDADFYDSEGGGVTFSGGEPLMQADFLLELLPMISYMHRAIETSGYLRPATYKEIYQNLDLVIQDIKIFNREKHRRYIGVDNDWILENAEYLKHGDKPFIIRIPLIPGVSDTEENYQQISSFFEGAKNLIRVELLPYVTVAGAKYGMVGREYKPDFDANQKPIINQAIFEKKNIRSMVL